MLKYGEKITECYGQAPGTPGFKGPWGSTGEAKGPNRGAQEPKAPGFGPRMTGKNIYCYNT